MDLTIPISRLDLNKGNRNQIRGVKEENEGDECELAGATILASIKLAQLTFDFTFLS